MRIKWMDIGFPLVLLIAFNSMLAVVAAIWGGDWRCLVPSVGVGAVIGQQGVCAINVIWGRGNLLARMLLQFVGMWLTAPVLAMSIRPQVEWADVKDCASTIFICATVLMTAFAAARLLGCQLRHSPSTAMPPQGQWWHLCVWLTFAMAVRPRVTGLADTGEWLKVLLHSATVFTVVAAGTRQLVIRFRRSPSAALLPRPQWSLATILSITTFICIWLGMAIAFRPFEGNVRHGPVRWGLMLALDVIWIPLFYVLGAQRTHFSGLAAATFVLTPAVVVITALLEFGQAGDMFVQEWFSRPHHTPDMDYGIRAGFATCLVVSEVEAGLVMALLALWRAEDVHLADASKTGQEGGSNEGATV